MIFSITACSWQDNLYFCTKLNFLPCDHDVTAEKAIELQYSFYTSYNAVSLFLSRYQSQHE